MKLFHSVQQARPELANADREVRVFQSETAEILEDADAGKAYRVVFVLALTLMSLIVVSFCIRVNRVVTSMSGKLVTVEPTIVLGAFDQSIIKTIDTQEGQQVKKGQVLATLDPTFAVADVNSLRSQLANLNAEIARCEAELAQKPFDVPFATDPVANRFIAAQREYYLQRKAQFDAQVRSYNEQIAQYQVTVAKYQNDEIRYGDRAKISREIEQMRATLAAAEIGSKLNLLAATDQKLEVERALEFDRNAERETQNQLDAAKATRDAYIQGWYGQVSQEMLTAKVNRNAAAEQLDKAAKHQSLVEVVAPEDAEVLKIAKLSPLSVLGGGVSLFDLAPLKSPLEAEIHVAERDIGFIRAGDPVTMKISAYDFIDHGTIDGKIRSISEGAFTAKDDDDPPDNSLNSGAYYKVFVSIGLVDLRNVPQDFRLMPGNTLTADIHIGSHSLFTYLFNGVVRGYPEPMRGQN